MECIIVDDCGTDESIAIAERMIAAYTGPILFCVLHHEYNRGLSASRNTGTLQAKGDYIYYLDSDDKITEDCIEKLMAAASKDPAIEMVQGNSLWHFPHNVTSLQIRNTKTPLAATNDEVRKCFYQNRQMCVNVWNKLIRREFLINNNILCQEGLLWEDTLWAFYLLKHLTKACFVPDITHHYIKRPTSITEDTDNRNRGINYNIIYHDIITNMTPGHEREEYIFFAPEIGIRYTKYVKEAPEIKETFQLWLEKTNRYGNRFTTTYLSICNSLGKFKYGWLVLFLHERLMNPYLIFRDVERVSKSILSLDSKI
jgi:glycosyltransferase involved in cell wall biosynthesis